MYSLRGLGRSGVWKYSEFSQRKQTFNWSSAVVGGKEWEETHKGSRGWLLLN